MVNHIFLDIERVKKMEWKTHFISGVIVGTTITGDWKGALIGGVAAVIPDIDEPRSKIGRLLFPISILVSSFFKHRTFTHSLLFMGIVTLLIQLIFFNSNLTLTILGGLVAHVIGDILTGKVNLLYPLDKWIGIEILPSMYILIDRLSRYGMIAFCLWYVVTNFLPSALNLQLFH